MAEAFEVLGIAQENTEPIQVGDGTLNKFIVELKQGDRTLTAEHWRKVGSNPDFDAGDVISGDITNAKRGGLKLGRVSLGDGAANATPSQQTYISSASKSSSDTGRSIERQVALKSAVKWAGASGEVPSTESVVAAAEDFDRFLRGEKPADQDENVPF